MAKTLFTDIREVLTLAPANAKYGRHINEQDLGVKKNMAMVVDKGRIEWMGPQKKIPKDLSKNKKLKEVCLQDLCVLPGFVECHTHSVFAGNRAEEFELRNQGMSYQEIAKRGGGILSTMKNTRQISEKDLLRISQARVDHFVAQGVTTLEVKSGYALDLKNELKMLKVIAQLEGPEIVPTFLGAHAKPPEYATTESYLQYLADIVLPTIKKKGLAKRVDIFVEKGFFEAAAARQYLQAAQGLGFEVVIHADQLSLSGGADLCLELKALSGDHLLKIQNEEIRKLSQSEVTCVLLPAADLYMKCPYPPARALIEAGARVALATDFNPGTCPTQDLSLVGVLARTEMKMTLAEVLSAYTVGAAYALNRQRDVGSLELGKYANFMCNAVSWQETFYSAGACTPTFVYKAGELIHQKR